MFCGARFFVEGGVDPPRADGDEPRITASKIEGGDGLADPPTHVQAREGWNLTKPNFTSHLRRRQLSRTDLSPRAVAGTSIAVADPIPGLVE